VLNPASGRVRSANAGHHVPYLRRGGGVAELRATGMPLGLMLGTNYEENETVIILRNWRLIEWCGSSVNTTFVTQKWNL
jgi:hypothetical protein